jgi:hypothetical protein
MSHHFANIFSFSGNHEETNADLPIVKVHCNTTTDHDNTTETCNNLATINDNQEYEDYEIRITSVPGPKGDPGGVGGPIDETLVPEHTNVDIGTETIPFRTIYSECVETDVVTIQGHSIYVSDNKIQLPAETRFGGMIPGSIRIKDSFHTENEIPLSSLTLGDAYLIGNGPIEPVHLYICTKIHPPQFKNVGNITGPAGPVGPVGETGEIGPVGPTGPKGNAGPGLFYFETTDVNMRLDGSNVATKIDGVGVASKAYSKQMYPTCSLSFSPPTQPVSSEIGLAKYPTLQTVHRINFITSNQYFINSYLDSHDYHKDDIFTIVVSNDLVKFFQNDIVVKEFPNQTNSSLKAYISLYEVGSTVPDIQFGYAISGQTGPMGPAGPSVNLTPLNNSVTSLNNSITTLQGQINQQSTSIASLTSLTNGLTGNATSLTVQSKLNVKKTSDLFVPLNTSSSTIDYNTSGNFLYNNASTPGPYTFLFTNMTDLQSSSHTITVLHKITENNKQNCYINDIRINGEFYLIQWFNRQQPIDVLSNVASGGIVKQTFTILPKEFSNNTIITQLFYYRSL